MRGAQINVTISCLLISSHQKTESTKVARSEINVTILWLYIFPIENNKNAKARGARINVTFACLLIFPQDNNKNIKIVTLKRKQRNQRYDLVVLRFPN